MLYWAIQYGLKGQLIQLVFRKLDKDGHRGKLIARIRTAR